MDYRKFYMEQLFLKELSNDFEIHHIDFNHDNNELVNLLALPKKLHNDLHKTFSKLQQNFVFKGELKSNISNGFKSLNYYSVSVSKYTDIYYECSRWFDLKLYFLDEIPYTLINKEVRYY